MVVFPRITLRKPTLLPDAVELKLESIVAEPDRVVLTVSACRKGAFCPQCKCSSNSVHSYYVRTLSDLPWNGIAVCVRLSSRRFFCRNDLCRQSIFTERFSGTAARYARRTLRLNEAVTLLGFTTGGRGGARLACELGMKTSEDTILRCVRDKAISKSETPRVLGVDDWAMRKGHSYGTILCDLERHRVVDLLPDRSRDTLAEWLRQHPGIEIISRDRASAYSEAASLAAPTARQVADRWHLLRNVGEALRRVLERNHALLRKAAQNVVVQPEAKPAKQKEVPAPAEPENQRSKDRRAARLARYEEVRELARRGMYQRAIARKTGLDRRTIRLWLRADSFPERKLPNRSSRADGFADYLKQRFTEGCHNSAQLWRELCEKGYRGAKSQVRNWVHRHLRENPSPSVSASTVADDACTFSASNSVAPGSAQTASGTTPPIPRTAIIHFSRDCQCGQHCPRVYPYHLSKRHSGLAGIVRNSPLDSVSTICRTSCSR